MIRKTILFFLFSSCLFANVKTVVDIQPQKQDFILDVAADDGSDAGFVRLINLNPSVNVWFLLYVTWPGEKTEYVYHLENIDPRVNVILDNRFKWGLALKGPKGSYNCRLWKDPEDSELRDADKKKKTFVPICEDRLYVRNQTTGKETAKEFVTDFLRSHVPGGEQITTLVKNIFYKDRFLLVPEDSAVEKAETGPKAKDQQRPPSAIIAKEFKTNAIQPKDLGIGLKDHDGTSMIVGEWYETATLQNVYVSLIQPKLIDGAILKTHADRVKKFDGVEDAALVYLVAFSLRDYDLGFAMGTKHPSVEWSDRAPSSSRNDKLPGPDGIGNVDPLTMTGKVNPHHAQTIIATFTAGFKRTHGAFKWGDLSKTNHASHYGFIENGVVLSWPHPGLATTIIKTDGEVLMKTWQSEDEKMLGQIRHARQNGVAIVERDSSGVGIPGKYAGNWMLGNWSGSQSAKLRALRAAVCLIEKSDQKFLVYGYFSSVTPNSMARVFQAYGCSYAMHMDMNALEHTYLAVYPRSEGSFDIQHLIGGMEVLDRKVKGQKIPRFVGTADNRDFFYLFKKKG